jgi:NADPH:quinone reductase-like Zn-dependent oxidoreductase
MTAITMLTELNVQRGEFLLQSAAASAIGRQMIQIAKVKKTKTKINN